MACSLVASLAMLFMSPSCSRYLRKWASVSLLIQRNRPRYFFLPIGPIVRGTSSSELRADYLWFSAIDAFCDSRIRVTQ
jgi:hypothetical protein